MIEVKNNHSLLRYFQHIQGSSFFTKINNQPIWSQYKEPTLMNCPYVANPLTALSEKTRLLIQGNKGHGKTALLKYLCHSLSVTGDNTTKMYLGEVIPFYFDVKILDMSIFKDYESFIKSFSDLNIDCLGELLENGQVLLLIDNIDYIPGGKGDKVFTVLDKFINNNPSTSVIFTITLKKQRVRLVEHCLTYNFQNLTLMRS